MITFNLFLNELKQSPQRLNKSLNAVIAQDGTRLYSKIKVGFEIEGYFCIPLNSSLFNELTTPYSEKYRELMLSAEQQPKLKNYLQLIFDVAKQLTQQLRLLNTSTFEINEKLLTSIHHSIKKLFDHADFNSIKKELTHFDIHAFVIACHTLYKAYLKFEEAPITANSFLKKQEIALKTLINTTLFKDVAVRKIIDDSNFRAEGMKKMLEFSGNIPELYFSLIANEIKKNVPEITTIVSSNQYQTHKENKVAWRVEYDSSLDQELAVFKENKNYYLVIPVEIISPPLFLNSAQLETAEPIKIFKNLLTFLNKKENDAPIFTTTETSGLHFNISGFETTSAQKTSIDWLLFFVYLESGETGVLKLFDREGNHYARSQLTQFKKEYSGTEGIQLFFTSKNNKTLDISKLISVSEKHYSGNLSKKYEFTKDIAVKAVDAPIEIRGMGNAHYHLEENFHKIKLTIEKVIYALMLSSSRKEIIDALGFSEKELKKDKAKRMTKVLNTNASFISDDVFSIKNSKNSAIKYLRNEFLKCVKLLSITLIGNRFAQLENQPLDSLMQSLKEIKAHRELTIEEIRIYLFSPLKQLFFCISNINKFLKRVCDYFNLNKIESAQVVYFLGPTFAKIVEQSIKDLTTNRVLSLFSKEMIQRMRRDEGIEFDYELLDFLFSDGMTSMIEDIRAQLKENNELIRTLSALSQKVN